MLDWEYQEWKESLHRPVKDLKDPLAEAVRLLRMMRLNNWSQSDLAQHLGLSRARVTQILNVLKVPKSEIDRMRKDGVRIT